LKKILGILILQTPTYISSVDFLAKLLKFIFMGFFSFLVFLSILHPLLSFDCSSVSDRASCGQLAGCAWTAGACTGSFTPSCSSNICYYIDPTSGSDLQDGSAQNPFKTLTKGFNSLSNQAGSLMIINYGSEQEVEVLGYTIITSSISIM